MKGKRYISELISKYGVRQLLDDSNITIIEALEILWELGFLDLSQYDEEEDE